MRSSTAIGLVLLGGGVVTTAVVLPRHCKDPVTGAPIACPSGGSGMSGWGSSSGFHGAVGSSVASAAAAASAARGGFGGAGSAAHASAGG